MREEDMQPEEAKEIKERIENTITKSWELLRYLAKKTSTAGLLAENEPLGDLVAYTLIDDAAPESNLWVHFERLADWLKETEERYAKQFPADWPKVEGLYDLSTKPEGFKNRFTIFKEVVETGDSDEVWNTRLTLHDPIMVIRKFHTPSPKDGKQAGS
jgi:hypothetical protein